MKRAWGPVLVAALSAGCGPSPAARDASLELDDTERTAPAAGPPHPSHESRFEHLRTGDGKPQYGALSYRAVSSGVELHYTRVWPLDERGISRCPFSSPEASACGLLSVAPRGRSEGPAAPAPHDWLQLHAGKDRFYAQRIDPSYIDTISARGEVSAWLRDPRLSSLVRPSLVDLGDRIYVFGGEPEARIHEVQRKEGELAVLGPGSPFPFVAVATAEQARIVRSLGRRAMYGGSAIVLLGGDAWALAWIEAIPPPKRTPRRGSKNGCGRGVSHGPSRALADRSVEKHLTVTRFERTSVTSEERVSRDDDVDATTHDVQAELQGDRVVARVAPRPP